MIPTGLYEDYTAALSENDRQARAALKAIIAQAAPGGADALRDALLDAYPALVKVYGTRAAQVALEFYTGVRAEQGVESQFDASLHADDGSMQDECVSDVRREVKGLYSGETTTEAFTSTMQKLATKRTMQMADDTLYSLAKSDPAHPKVALVPHPGACGWCVMIGSRGFDNSEKAMENMRHDGCKCATVADFDRKNPALEGYDPDALYETYKQADSDENQAKWRAEWNEMAPEERAKYVRRTKDKTGKIVEHPGDWSTFRRDRTVQEITRRLGKSDGDLASMTATVRSVVDELGIKGNYSSVHVYSAYSKCQATIGQAGEWGELADMQRAAVLAELNERDTEWVRTGIAPVPTFETAELKARLLGKRNNHELRTGERVASHGVRADFQEDKYSRYDEAKGMWQDVGRADLANGYELKTLRNAKWSAVDGYLRDIRTKEGVRAVVVDNFENRGAITDANLIEELRKQRRWNGPLYLITRDNRYIRVK